MKLRIVELMQSALTFLQVDVCFKLMIEMMMEKKVKRSDGKYHNASNAFGATSFEYVMRLNPAFNEMAYISLSLIVFVIKGLFILFYYI